jgi:hypothetical protein
MGSPATYNLRGTFAQRPAAATYNNGWRYIQTDNGGADGPGEYQSNGSAWLKINSTIAIVIGVGDETTAITTGTGKLTFRMPFAFTLAGVRASLVTAQASGSIFTVDINESGATLLSTKLTIDNGEKTSTTAATPAVISDAAIADDAEISIDVDQIGASGAAGLKITLIGVRS